MLDYVDILCQVSLWMNVLLCLFVCFRGFRVFLSFSSLILSSISSLVLCVLLFPKILAIDYRSRSPVIDELCILLVHSIDEFPKAFVPKNKHKVM